MQKQKLISDITCNDHEHYISHESKHRLMTTGTVKKINKTFNLGVTRLTFP